nr:16S rRNA (guanine(527)-N(7))-methyltransferase RsmG [Tamilnaduibacter salinus]
MAAHEWSTQLDDGLARMELALTPDQRQRLLDFLGLLAKWNRAYNLTAVRDPAEMVSRQLLDSLSILPFLTADRILDVGAGGGLPGIPLAIACPERTLTLLDSNQKKTRFLTQCVLELGLDNVEVAAARAEAFESAVPFEQITCRAFTALDNLVNWCDHLLAEHGTFLAMKGVYPDDEVAALGAGWRLRGSESLTVPGCGGERHLLIIDRSPETGGETWRA